ncbi:MAG: Nif3-like dinuclear metal center hexameric protein [bacterium]|jgi:dinuclear metal center YbgI/SA1388 family protein
MLASIQTVMETVEQLAPRCLAENWDNVGLQLGDPQAEVTNILVALDMDEAVGKEAARCGANLAIVHHPLIFQPMRQIRYDAPAGRLLRQLIQNGTAVYVAHTNLDIAEGGVNTALADRLGLVKTRVLQPLSPAKLREMTSIRPCRDREEVLGLGRIGHLNASCHLEEFARAVRTRLGCQSVRVCGEPSRLIRKVAVCGGSGSSLIPLAARLGADVLVTGDVGYHDAQEAERLGLALIDAGHAATERPILPYLADYLRVKMAEGGFATAVTETKICGTQFWQN